MLDQRSLYGGSGPARAHRPVRPIPRGQVRVAEAITDLEGVTISAFASDAIFGWLTDRGEGPRRRLTARLRRRLSAPRQTRISNLTCSGPVSRSGRPRKGSACRAATRPARETTLLGEIVPATTRGCKTAWTAALHGGYDAER